MRIRDIVTHRVDIAQKIKFLRREIKKDIVRPEVKYATPNFDSETEKTDIDESVESISEVRDNFDGSNVKTYNRLKSGINHLFGTLYRIPDDITNETSNYRGDNIVGVSVLLDDLEEASDCHVGCEMQCGSSSSQGGAVVETRTQSKVILVHKWGVTFHGNAARCSVNSFLQRIEDLRVARNCSKNDIFQSAIDLFE
ncbi:hypothetical protein JTB14_023724 [Gonioctena quinquepunctata]|nr:hypothetical protein JTB14_023724 [Gonioctena quinquepunctata]